MIIYMSVAGEGKWVGWDVKTFLEHAMQRDEERREHRSTNLTLLKLKINDRRLLNTTMNFVITVLCYTMCRTLVTYLIVRDFLSVQIIRASMMPGTSNPLYNFHNFHHFLL